eukprot:gene7487-9796_t
MALVLQTLQSSENNFAAATATACSPTAPPARSPTAPPAQGPQPAVPVESFVSVRDNHLILAAGVDEVVSSSIGSSLSCAGSNFVFCLCCVEDEDRQQRIIRECYQAVSKRPDHVCNFLELSGVFDDNDCRLVYRHYATLYFVFAVDSSESELGILDLIQQFENVCELDLIFQVDKVHHILDEIVMGGMVLETNMNEVLTHVTEQHKLLKAEVLPLFLLPHHSTNLDNPVSFVFISFLRDAMYLQPLQTVLVLKQAGNSFFQAVANSKAAGRVKALGSRL